MRTTLSLDDDVAASLERIRKSEEAPFKDVVNAALRLGLAAMEKQPQPCQPFRTKTVSLGKSYLPNLDNIADVLAIAEGEQHK